MTPAEGAPAHALGMVETDAPCEACGFNLHGQRIWRDERLDLPLARCPECGRHHAVGKTMTAGSAWLGRLAVLGLLVWLAIGLTFVLASFGVLLAIQAGASDALLRRDFETVDGRQVYMTYNNTRPDRPGPLWAVAPYAGPDGRVLSEERRLIPKEEIVYRVRPSGLLRRPPGLTFRQVFRAEEMLLIVLTLAGTALAVIAIGAIAASASWFWRPRRRLVWLLLPVLAGVVMAVIEWTNLGTTYSIRVGRDSGMPILGTHLIATNVAGVAATQIVLLALGLWFGRSISRRLILIFIPPKARQAFAFLWHADGKTMPVDYVPRSNR